MNAEPADESMTESVPKLSWITRIAMMLGLGMSSHAVAASKTAEQKSVEFEQFIRDRIPYECRGGDVLPLVFYPNPLLRTESVMVTKFDDDFSQLVKSLGTTMYMCGGVGLSAIQVGIPLRVMVTDMRDLSVQSESKFRVFVNPVVISESEPVNMIEGCLSMPNVREMIVRPSVIRIRAQTETGVPFETELSGWPARVFLHELGHMEGEIFTDRLGKLARHLAEKRSAKLRRSVKIDTKNGQRKAAMRAQKGRGR